uniref:60S ribosomal export protein NMD3 n=4 Tax=Meloidogyne TaxID=189290 RepID=A0A914LGG1_MELIC
MQQIEIEPSFSEGIIACCECGAPIAPNPLNMCLGCVRSRVDILEGIVKQIQLNSCRNCSRYLVPPNAWIYAQLESKELMSICLGRLKAATTQQKLRIIDASFIWTEPHSKRLKVKVTIQKEVFDKAILQQSFVAEFVIANQMCDDCHRHEAKSYWRACVQVRQRCDYKKTLFYLEQLLLKNGAHSKCSSIKPVLTGIDFYFPRQQEARKMVDFVTAVLPAKFQHSQQLVTHDVRNNFYDYKHTYCVDIVPIIKDSLICLPKHLGRQFSSIGQFVVCLRVTEVVTLINTQTLQLFELNSNIYWKEPFGMLIQPKMLTEFYVLEVEEIEDSDQLIPLGHISKRHKLADVWVVKSDQVGQSNANSICCRTHLGHLLNPGDSVMGYNIWQSNLNDRIFDLVKEEKVPDVVLVRKVYDRTRRARKRQWKLKRILDNVETESVEREFAEFMEDVEEDAKLREKINIYKKSRKGGQPSISTMDDGENDEIDGPTLEEMLEDLDIDGDGINDIDMDNK